MVDGSILVAGIEIPSKSPIFLAMVGFHILAGLACVVIGTVAMLSPKGRGGHSKFGTIYFWCLAAVFISATALSAMRWAEDYHLFILGMLSFVAAILGRRALLRLSMITESGPRIFAQKGPRFWRVKGTTASTRSGVAGRGCTA